MTSKQKIRIVTDSVSDIPQDLLKKWGIALVPTFVNYNQQSYADDGVELDRAAYYHHLQNSRQLPTTAAPPPALVEKILREAMEGYDHAICIHVPSKYSVTMNNVRLGAQSIGSEKFTFIDSGTLTMGIGMQVLIAAQVAAETGDVQQVVQVVERVRVNQRLYAIIDTMEYVRRSGRVNTLVAALGTLLRIKPVVTVYDSDIKPIQRIRTYKKAVAYLQDLVREAAPFERCIMLHVQNESGAHDILEGLSDILPADTPIVEVGPTLGTHIGPGSVGVTFLPKTE
jgi:DegV family protein with EDD domain